MRIVFIFSLVAAGFTGAAFAEEHPLAGRWESETAVLDIDEDGMVATNVTTPAGFRQVFDRPLKWYSTSPTSGYYSTVGFFSYTHGNFPYQVACHHTVRMDAYLDHVHGGLVVNFRCPEQIWAVWQPDNGHCQESGVLHNQVIFDAVR